jgi:hypothetical protein
LNSAVEFGGKIRIEDTEKYRSAKSSKVINSSSTQNNQPMRAILFILLVSSTLSAQPVKVDIQKTGAGFQLLRGGKPYFIKGAGGISFLNEAKDAGANSVRTWHFADKENLLDEAHRLGLSVCLGFWVRPERQGMDYNDGKAVNAQFERFKEAVLKFKDHPALLCWAIGNEVDLNYRNTKVWNAIQDLAKMIHELDKNHPTATVIAGIKRDVVSEIKTKCPDIDFLGINVYGDIENVPRKVREFGWEKPYFIGEWSSTGHWEVPKTKWSAPIEQSSTERAKLARARYANSIAKDSAMCLGGYVFIWGQKQERTPTWYGVFTESKEKTEMVEVMTEFWTGNKPSNTAPKILSFKINDQTPLDNITLAPRQPAIAAFAASDPENDALQIRWEFLPESADLKEGGDRESRPETLNGLIQNETQSKMTFLAPEKEGAYRLFLYVSDGKGAVAAQNIPFFVQQ